MRLLPLGCSLLAVLLVTACDRRSAVNEPCRAFDGGCPRPLFCDTSLPGGGVCTRACTDHCLLSEEESDGWCERRVDGGGLCTTGCALDGGTCPQGLSCRPTWDGGSLDLAPPRGRLGVCRE